MVAYSFKAKFLPTIRSGFKTQTIRKPRTGRSRHARAGEELQLYTGSRFKPQLVGRATCEGSFPIHLNFSAGRVIVNPPAGAARIAIHLRDPVGLDAFACLDGFAGWDELRKFWLVTHGAVHSWDGAIIYWKDFRPCP